VIRRRRSGSVSFAGYRFAPEVIVLAVRWYLRYGLSYRDVEELLAERGVDVDHVTIYRWVQRFTPLVIEAARPCRHSVGNRWFVEETYVRVGGVWRYVYRAVDQYGQIIDVFVSKRRNILAATKFFEMMLAGREHPTDVTTDLAAPLLRVVDDLLPEVLHDTTQYANNRIECDHGRLKSRLRPMRGLRTDRTASKVIRGHAFIQNLRRGHYNSAAQPATSGYASRQPSMNSPKRSDRRTRPHRCAAPLDRSTQQCPTRVPAGFERTFITVLMSTKVF
jgi:transposase-like protein